MKVISEPSVKSLFIEMHFGETKLSSGTGFIAITTRGMPVLVTNRHNVTGRNQISGQPISSHGGIPDRVIVWQNSFNGLGHWHRESYAILDSEGAPLWHEHPELGNAADVVALPIKPGPLAKLYPYSLEEPSEEIRITPAEPINIIGFPFGLSSSGRFAIWATGFVATEPDLDYDGKPMFLVDCRARPGQSGSPVVAVRSGTTMFKNGDISLGGGTIVDFLGIYSGRINEQSDLGMVWKRPTIRELVQAIPTWSH